MKDKCSKCGEEFSYEELKSSFARTQYKVAFPEKRLCQECCDQIEKLLYEEEEV